MNEFLKSKEAEFDENFPEGERRGYQSYPFPLRQIEIESIKEFLSSSLKEAYVKGLEAAKGALSVEDTGEYKSTENQVAKETWNECRSLTLSNIQKLIEEI